MQIFSVETASLLPKLPFKRIHGSKNVNCLGCLSQVGVRLSVALNEMHKIDSDLEN